MKIVFATQNKGKINELKSMFNDIGYEVYSMGDIGLDLDIEENGITYEENAMIKAKALYNALDEKEYIVMADDSGIEVEALDNKPGIYSARYNGVSTPWPEKNQMMLDEIGDNANRKARFVTCIAVVMKDGLAFTKRGIVEGEITKNLTGKDGFGYDPIFMPEGFNKTFAEMTKEEKSKISHRGRAIEKVKSKVIELNK